MNSFKKRLQETLLERGMKVMPVVIVTGARQTGKTTLVRDLTGGKDRAYLTLDRFEILSQAQARPEALAQATPLREKPS